MEKKEMQKGGRVILPIVWLCGLFVFLATDSNFRSIIAYDVAVATFLGLLSIYLMINAATKAIVEAITEALKK